jgi:hypothetical protein
MADTQIVLTVSAQIADLQAKMATATSAIQAAAANMAAAFPPIADAASDAYGQMAELAAQGTAAIVENSEVTRNAAISNKESAEESKNAFKEAAEGLTKLREEILHLAEAFLVFKAIDWAKDAISSSLELGEKLANMSVQTDISVRNLQALQFAAVATGSEFERLTMFVSRLSHATAEIGVQTTGPAAGLRLLGIDPSALNDTYEGLLKISDAVNRLGPSSLVVREAFRDMGGRMGVSFIRTIEVLREFDKELERSGLALSPVMISKLKDAQESFNILGFVWQQDKAILVSELTPALEAAARILTLLLEHIGQWELSTGGVEAASKRFGEAMFGVAEAIVSAVIPALEEIKSELNEIASIAEHIRHPFATLAELPSDLLKGSNEAAIASAQKLLAAAPAGSSQIPQIKEYISHLQAANAEIDKLGSGAFNAVAGIGLGAASANPLVNSLLADMEKLHKEWEANQGLAPKGLGGTGKGEGKLPGPPETPAEIARGIEEQAKAAESALSIQEALNKQRLAYGQETANQEIAIEIDLANQKFTIEENALKRAAAIAGLKPAEHHAILAQIVELESKHQAEILGLQTKAQEASNKIAEERLTETLKINTAQIEYQKAVVDSQIKLDQITAEQGATIKRSFLQEEFAAETKEVNDELALHNRSLEEQRKLSEKLIEISDKQRLEMLKNATEIAEANKKAAEESAKAWQASLEPIGKTMDAIVNDWLDGTNKMAEAFRKTVANMVKSWIESGIMGLLVGGEKGSISEGLFGTKGGGALAGGPTATGGALGLGGGLAGLLSGLLPGGIGGIFGRLLGTAPTGAASLTELSVAAQLAADALLRLAGAPAGGFFSGGALPSTLPPTSVVPSGLPALLPPTTIVEGNTTATLANTAATITQTSTSAGTALTSGAGTATSAAGTISGAVGSGLSAGGASPFTGLSTSLSGELAKMTTMARGWVSGFINILTTIVPGFGTLVNAIKGLFGLITPAAGAAAASETALSKVSVLAAAGKAAAWQFADVMAAVPFPENLGVAPAAAAAAGAQALAYGVAEEGGIVGPSPKMVLLHPEEMVLPAPISRAVQEMATTSGATSSAATSGPSLTSMVERAFEGAQSTISNTFGTAFQDARGIVQATFGGSNVATSSSTLINAGTAHQTAATALQGAATSLQSAASGTIFSAPSARAVVPIPSAAAGMIVPSAEAGMIVPSAAAGMVMASGGQIAIVHPEEMVLPAPISRGVQNMITAAGAGREPGTPAQGDHISINYGDINAIDTRGIRELLAEHAATISQIVTTHLNRKGGRYPTWGAA